MIRQKFLFLWADYWLQHVVKVAMKGIVGIAILSGVAAPIITTIPSRHKSIPSVPVVAARPAPKVAVTPIHKSVPAAVPPSVVVPPINPPPAATHKVAQQPTPFPKTAPSPGSGAKTLIPAAPAAAPGPATNNTPSPSTAPSPNSASTILPPASGGYTSTNWSGYVATHGSYSGVSGAWKVPTVTGNGSTSTADSSWIGIGGVFANDLIQTGTENSVSANGQVVSAAFYELLPDAALHIPSLAVTAGDNMAATISEIVAGTWLIGITDTTTGQTYTTSVNYTSSHSSAEWIEEDPSYLDGSQVPFDNFGTANFSNGAATTAGTSATIALSHGQPITMLNTSGQIIAQPSILASDGSTFNVTRK